MWKLFILMAFLVSAIVLAVKFWLEPTILLRPVARDQSWYDMQSQLDVSLMFTILGSAAIGAAASWIVFELSMRRTERLHIQQLAALRAMLSSHQLEHAPAGHADASAGIKAPSSRSLKQGLEREGSLSRHDGAGGEDRVL